jgi:signal transduction histidine kinase
LWFEGRRRAPPAGIAERRDMIPRSGLFRKYAAALMLLVGAALIASGLIEMVLIYRATMAATATLQRAEVRTAVIRIEQYLDAIRAHMLDVSGLPWQSGMLDPKDRRDEFHRLMKLVAPISELRHFDGRGRERLKVSRIELDEIDAGRDGGDNDNVVRARTRGVHYSPTYFKDGSEPYMTLAVADREAPLSVTLAEVNLKFVGEVVSQLQPGKDGKVYVVDSADHLVAHPNMSLVLRKTDLSGYAPLQKMRQGLGEGGAVVGMIDAEGLEGGPAMLSAGFIPASGWLVVVEQPQAEVLDPVYAAITRTGVLFMAGLLAALLVSYFLARRLAEPILEVRRGAEKLARGDLSTRISVKTGDEVEGLSREFNRMADQLQDYTTGLERKVAEKTAQLELANRHKSEFLANMSHELRTPLNAIIGFSEVLKERMFGELNAKQGEYVGDIYGSGQHLLSLINDILDLAKVEAGRMELDVHEFDVGAAIGNCATLIRERAVRSRLQFGCEIDPAVGAWRGDERKFKQVVLNLLTNAVKFTPPGGEVRLRAFVEDAQLRVSVTDTGVGIARADQDAIFTEFHQLRGSGMGELKNEGTGLGLALSRRLMQLHGGALGVESAPGKGSTFTASFPLAPAGDAHA